MTAIERRSFERKGWAGLAVLAAIPLVGVTLLSASINLFFSVLLAMVLLATAAVGVTLLRWKLKTNLRTSSTSR